MSYMILVCTTQELIESSFLCKIRILSKFYEGDRIFHTFNTVYSVGNQITKSALVARGNKKRLM